MKIGFVSLPASGHLNPMTALARKMQARGNEVVFIGFPDTEAAIRAANLRFVPFCESEYPMGSVAKALGGVAKLHGLDVVRHWCREVIPGLLRGSARALAREDRRDRCGSAGIGHHLLLSGTCADAPGNALCAHLLRTSS